MAIMLLWTLVFPLLLTAMTAVLIENKPLIPALAMISYSLKDRRQMKSTLALCGAIALLSLFITALQVGFFEAAWQLEQFVWFQRLVTPVFNGAIDAYVAFIVATAWLDDYIGPRPITEPRPVSGPASHG